MADDEQNESPARFGPGARSQQRPAPTNQPINQAQTSQPGQGPEEESPELPPDLEPNGFRAKLGRLRDLGRGEKSPLGSPDSRTPAPNPSPSRSWDSSDKKKVVDACAIGIRQGSTWLDWILGKRFPDKDFVATAQESYAIAAPLAGELLDRIPETGPLSQVAERAGAVGTGICTASWLARAFTGQPGGKAEAEALQEKVVTRLAGAKRHQRAEVKKMIYDTAAQAGEAPSRTDGAEETYDTSELPSYETLLGLDDSPGFDPDDPRAQ